MFLAFVLAASIIHAQSDMTVEDLMSGDDRSLYEVLGVTQNTDVTYTSLKKIINKNYPAKGEANLDNLDEIRKGVVAYSVLSTPELKDKYDIDGLKAVNDKVKVPVVSIPMYEGEPWADVMHSKCLFKVKYPKKEWLAKHYGVVVISYVIGADKTVRDIRIEESSGHSVLDKEVLKAFSKVAKKGVKHLQPSISLVNGTPSDTRMEFGVYFSKNRMGLTNSEESVENGVAQRTGYPRGWEYVSGRYDYSRYNMYGFGNGYGYGWSNRYDGTLPPLMGPNDKSHSYMYGGPYGRNTSYQDRPSTEPAKAGR